MTLKQGKTVLSCNHTDIGVTHQCCKAGGASVWIDPALKMPVCYAHHMLNPQETYYQPRMRNVIYQCLL